MSKKNKSSEAGYLLLESLVTVMMLTAIIVILYPLIVDWLIYRQQAKDVVEQNRQLYESSMIWGSEMNRIRHSDDGKYSIEMKKNKIKLVGTEVEVVIYESHFE